MPTQKGNLVANTLTLKDRNNKTSRSIPESDAGTHSDSPSSAALNAETGMPATNAMQQSQPATDCSRILHKDLLEDTKHQTIDNTHKLVHSEPPTTTSSRLAVIEADQHVCSANEKMSSHVKSEHNATSHEDYFDDVCDVMAYG